MAHHVNAANEHQTGRHPPSESYWRSGAGKATTIALAAGALLLGYEYRAAIFTASLAIWLPLFLCLGMYAFMHRGHHRHSHRNLNQAEDHTASNGAKHGRETE